MSKYLDDYNLKVLTNIISGVQSYGQRYSTERRWDAWADAYTNSNVQHSITIGWAQNYGDSALGLLKYIQQKYPTVFAKYDTADIATDIKRTSWVSKPYYQITKTSAKGKAIIAIITTTEGKKCQDEYFQLDIEKYLEAAKSYGLNMSNYQALMMWCEIRHLGGLTPTKRIFNKCGKNPSLDAIMTALKEDQKDTSSSNQVGDQKYQSRHDCCYKWIKQYAKAPTNTTTTPTTTTTATNSTSTVVKETEEKGNNNMAIDFSKYYNKISNSGGDQYGDITGGQAGDQTGNEWNIRNWYSRPWTCVLRHPDKTVRELIAELGIQAANNNKIGYDQNQRGTYWTQLKASGYRPSKITVACEADCSAGVIANTRAAGYLLNRNELKNINADYTGNMRSGYKAAGFQVLTDSKYLTSSAYLIPGDILLYDGHHTATNLGIGSKSGYNPDVTPAPTPSDKGKTEAGIPIFDGTNYLKTPAKTGKVSVLLNIRKGAGTNYANLISYPTLSAGTQVGVCMSLTGTNSAEWYYIKIDGSKGTKYGFASARYIEIL